MIKKNSKKKRNKHDSEFWCESEANKIKYLLEKKTLLQGVLGKEREKEKESKSERKRH